MTENPKKAVILGGGFDPAHKGHVNSTLYVKEQRGFDSIIFVPTGISPHKQGKKKTANHIRKHILNLSLEGVDGAIIDSFELDKTDVCYFYRIREQKSATAEGGERSECLPCGCKPP